MIWTVVDILRASTEFLSRQRVDGARLDAEVLLAHVLGKSRLDLYLMHDMPVDEGVRARYRELVRARARATPVAYLIGGREFYGIWFDVDARVLIPRPETEHLVDAGLEWLAENAASGRLPLVIDVCTGSGCVAVAMALRHPGATFVAADVSDDALAVARKNVERLVPGRVDLVRSDLLASVRPGEAIDLLVANPPYVTQSEFAEVSADVKQEPEMALLCGDDPLSFHKSILQQAWPRVSSGGRVALELGAGASDLVAWIRGAYPDSLVRVRDDYAKHPRVVIADKAR